MNQIELSRVHLTPRGLLMLLVGLVIFAIVSMVAIFLGKRILSLLPGPAKEAAAA